MDSRTNEKASITVAAKALGVSAKTIQRWVKSGKIKGIREDNRVFIPIDEIRARLQEQRASVADIVQDKKEDVQTIKGHSEDKSIDVIPITRTHYEGLLTRLGQLEASQQLLLEYKEGLQEKERELSETKATLSANTEKLAAVRSSLDVNSSELEQARATITKARNELQRLLEIKQDAEAKGKMVLDQQAALEARERELAELRMKLEEEASRPWWRRLFRK